MNTTEKPRNTEKESPFDLSALLTVSVRAAREDFVLVLVVVLDVKSSRGRGRGRRREFGCGYRPRWVPRLLCGVTLSSRSPLRVPFLDRHSNSTARHRRRRTQTR